MFPTDSPDNQYYELQYHKQDISGSHASIQYGNYECTPQQLRFNVLFWQNFYRLMQNTDDFC